VPLVLVQLNINFQSNIDISFYVPDNWMKEVHSKDPATTSLTLSG